ncbi:MAG: tRNA (N(6)-L-threonylcarbamoyladenosine(37)-C(2))-methylthiotransferase MtaB, partial [Candidatus Saccharibacteria bacterium]|nr:tRNA (N(6)-L-threonylcarbamoyladenosine(37)-C(2))-methylthiotransferase MtaB [Pseudorhodobacter sp.]
HLQAQIGQTHQVLVEGPRLGRTEQFAEVSFQSDQSEGQIQTITITGASQTRLIG